MEEIVVVHGHREEIAGQPIRRLLPSSQLRSVGPFVFFDHILPHHYPAGADMNIAQHPHIGLSTLTYLLEGQLQHKDSLGSDQRVGPGDVSWMTAGAGIAHVERTPPPLNEQLKHLHGLQVWVALPEAEETCTPSYQFCPAASLPTCNSLGAHITLIAGEGFCMQSPVAVRSPCVYAYIRLAAGATLALEPEHPERAIYLISGQAQLDDHDISTHTLNLLPSATTLLLRAYSDCEVALLGGESVGPRRLFWNLVATDRKLIDAAKQNWASGQWPTVPGENQRLELPAPIRRQ